jgi:hypothetical protein
MKNKKISGKKIAHKLGDKIERSGEKLKRKGADKIGEAVYRTGDTIEHSLDKDEP